MTIKYLKRSARHSYEEDNRIMSMTDEFYFVVYSTYNGNRTTLAIYRNADGERKEVNFVLAHKPAKNIGKKIKKAIADLRKKPINKLYQCFIQLRKSQYRSGKIPDDVVSAPTEAISMKEPRQTKEEVLIKILDNAGFKHDQAIYVQRVCRTCQTFGDCIVMDDLPICDNCKTKDDFKEKYRKQIDQKVESRGGIAPSKIFWCRACEGGEGNSGYGNDTDEDGNDYMNDFGGYCRNPDCPKMYVCEVHNTIWNRECYKLRHTDYELDKPFGREVHGYTVKNRFVTFDLTIEQRVCRKCLNFVDCQTIGKKAICKKCKQLRIERVDVNYGKSEKIICWFCKKFVLPSDDTTPFLATLSSDIVHIKCFKNYQKENNMSDELMEKMKGDTN